LDVRVELKNEVGCIDKLSYFRYGGG